MTKSDTVKMWTNSGYALGAVLTEICLLRNKPAKNSVAVAGSRLSMWSDTRIAFVWLGVATLMRKITRSITESVFYRATELVVTKTA